MLAELAGEVHTIERIPELAEQARENLAAAGYDACRSTSATDRSACPDEAPFDGDRRRGRGARRSRELLYEQLEPRGRLASRSAGAGPAAGGDRAQPGGPGRRRTRSRAASCRSSASRASRSETRPGRRARGRAGRLLQGRGAGPGALARRCAAGFGTRRTAPLRRSSKATTTGSTRWSLVQARASRSRASTTSRRPGPSRRRGRLLDPRASTSRGPGTMGSQRDRGRASQQARRPGRHRAGPRPST